MIHHPDPTAASDLARKIADYRPTLMAGTPTFVNSILGRGQAGQLKSLRLIFVGAEKCPRGAVRKAAPSCADRARCWRATASPSVRRSSR